MVFLGVPSFASHTTNIQSGPSSAVTIISNSGLYAVQVIALQCPYKSIYVLFS
jgi:hypothetical protein